MAKNNPAAIASALLICAVFCSCAGNPMIKSELPPQMPQAQKENLADPSIEEAVNDYMNAQGPYEEMYVSDDRFIEHTWMGFDEFLTSELNTFTEDLINSLP